MDRAATKPLSVADVDAELRAIRATGGWLPWTGFALALLWWAGAGVFAWFWLGGTEGIFAVNPGVLLAGAMMLLLPGLMMIVGASMAAENLRSARANALVLTAANRLLHPAHVVAGESQVLADSMKSASQRIDAEVRKALDTLAEGAKTLGDERMRIESVSLACADNARDLTARLTEERRSLETLARELRAQAEALNEAIPRQAELMISSAKKAAAEVGEADRALETRLTRLKSAADALSQAVTNFDVLAGDAGQRQTRFAQEMARLHETLKESRELTEKAVKASGMATQAAQDTGAALRNAVADAIERAHKAAVDIRALAKQAGEAGPTPRQAPVTNGREVPNGAANGTATANGANGANGHQHAPSGEAPSRIPPPERPVATPAHAPKLADAQSPDPSVDLFEDDADDDLLEAEAAEDTGTPAPSTTPPPVIRRPDLPETPSAAVEPRESLASSLTGNGSSLRDILADIDREEEGLHGNLDSGIELIGQLETSGIQLPRIFRSKDTKKLTQAARRGEAALRQTVRNIANGEVERVAVRLRKDGRLHTLARHFLDQDGHDIVAALAAKARTGDATQPRISAFLLVDAALNAER